MLDNMQIRENVELAKYSTMNLGGRAKYLCDVTSRSELVEAYEFAKDKGIDCIPVGTGSNITWRDEGYPGLVVVSDIKGIEIEWQNDKDALVTIGSGEVWDKAVEECVGEGLSGIEALSLIPGKAGATPVQNVGAYGQEIADTLLQLEVYNTNNGKIEILHNQDCKFGYRTSRFKTKDHARYFIITITLQLSKQNMSPPFYAVLEKYLELHNVTEYTPANIRKAVIDIRSSKLPDPKTVHNNGSFFANPIVSSGVYNDLLTSYPDMPSWPAGNNEVKIPAAWLIEKAGFKDYHDDQTGMATWPSQPLVIVNEHAKSTKDLITFRDKIINGVKSQFGITLKQEPEILP